MSVLVLALSALSCAKPRPVIQEILYAQVRSPITKIAVMPFYPVPGLREAAKGGETAYEVVGRVGRMVTEAIQNRGVEVIPSSDLDTAFAGIGEVTPRGDAALAATVASREFGAQAVLLGQVSRYSNRGEPAGPPGGREVAQTTEREPIPERRRETYAGEGLEALPASVAFTVTLYEAPGGRRLWSARFDETQRALTSDIRNLRRYPGGGTRWLSASELASWGANAAAEAMPLGRGGR